MTNEYKSGALESSDPDPNQELWRALLERSSSRVKAALDAGADPTMPREGFSKTPLDFEIHRGFLLSEVGEDILQWGEVQEGEWLRGRQFKSKTKTLAYLIQACHHRSKPLECVMTAHSFMRIDVEAVKLLSAYGVDFNQMDRDGYPLIWGPVIDFFEEKRASQTLAPQGQKIQTEPYESHKEEQRILEMIHFLLEQGIALNPYEKVSPNGSLLDALKGFPLGVDFEMLLGKERSIRERKALEDVAKSHVATLKNKHQARM